MFVYFIHSFMFVYFIHSFMFISFMFVFFISALHLSTKGTPLKLDIIPLLTALSTNHTITELDISGKKKKEKERETNVNE